MNEKIKIAAYIVIALAISIAFGLVRDRYRKPVESGELVELNRTVQQETDRTIKELERTIREQRERADSLELYNSQFEASNNRLAEHLGNASRISAELSVSAESTAPDIRSAIELLEKITIQIEDLNRELDSCRADLYRIRDLAGLQTNPVAETPP
jgi:predicted RNase H-like nuclease (RuvC/YqgF family)